MSQSNSTRFINAYNKIDKMLRNLHNLKPSLTFTDVVRRTASVSTLMRKFEDDLLDYGRLRNAIVHKSDSDMVIAEPHERVVLHIEHIAELVSTPPRADKTVASSAVTIAENTKLVEAIKIMAPANFSNLPVVSGREIVGVLNNKQIVEAFALHLDDIADFIKNVTVREVLRENSQHYLIVKVDINIDDVLTLFYNNPKLQIVVLTNGGAKDGNITGVVTTGDVLKIHKILEDY